MKQYRVTFEWANGAGQKGTDTVMVEAGNRKNAYIRALGTLSVNAQYSGCYKKIISVEEAA